jgi:hypothetical protein
MTIPDIHIPITVEEVTPEIIIELLIKLHIIENVTDDEQWIQTKVFDKMNIGDKKSLVAGKMILQYEKLNSISNLQE